MAVLYASCLIVDKVGVFETVGAKLAFDVGIPFGTVALMDWTIVASKAG